jgi:hypothetical protein
MITPRAETTDSPLQTPRRKTVTCLPEQERAVLLDHEGHDYRLVAREERLNQRRQVRYLVLDFEPVNLALIEHRGNIAGRCMYE